MQLTTIQISLVSFEFLATHCQKNKLPQ